MGALFSKPSVPKAAPTPPPPPLPAPKPTPVSESSAEVDEAQRERKKAELRSFGRNSTILSGDTTTSGKKSILGG
jgi:hypothetical protein